MKERERTTRTPKCLFVRLLLGLGCAITIFLTGLTGDFGILQNAKAAGTVYNAFNDFSSTSNPAPSGNWRYGYTQTLGSTINLYASHETVLGGINVWSPAPSSLPGVSKNVTSAIITSGSAIFPYFDYLSLHPGPNGEYSVLRWTAPYAGAYQISARFDSLLLRWGQTPTTTDVHVLHNSSPIFNDFINGVFTSQVKDFTTILNLNEGDTIDFAVGIGQNNSYASDSTGVRAIISTDLSPTPTPVPNFSIEELPLPQRNSVPVGIVEGADKNIYFAEFAGNRIARITPQGAMTEFTVPTSQSHPLSIVSGPDGNLWFTEWSGNKIARMTLTGSFQEYTIPTPGNYIENLTFGHDGNIWFSEAAANNIGRLTPLP